MDFSNATELDDALLHALLIRHTHPYRHDGLKVRVRYSRGADFSGTCFGAQDKIYVNLGRANRYPYTLGTNVARARTTCTGWRRDIFRLTVRDASQLVLFVYLHELYHWLVRGAGRSPHRKEAMCDRFATAVLVDCYGCALRSGDGRPAPRGEWDFKDLHAFVARAPQARKSGQAARRPIPVTIRDGENRAKSRPPRVLATRGFAGTIPPGIATVVCADGDDAIDIRRGRLTNGVGPLAG